ncbi:hypothetical protein BDQ17DRAFT_1548254 [Cyathus striatus]|nr:hypothetical protein BDQ17DRAFT_1548254 [Cyathus striatus]
MSTSPAQPIIRKCGWCNQKDGKFRCTRCRDAVPPAMYCSKDCQKTDWQFHKKYCGKYSYTFDLTLVGSSNPPIKRTFDVPSCLRIFMTSVFRPSPSGNDYGILAMRDQVLRIIQRDSLEHELTLGSRGKIEFEEILKLKDVYGEDGRLKVLTTNPATGKAYPLLYLYDFGDHWEHLLEFRGQNLASAARPLVTSATGCAPVEDSGAIPGWNSVKAAFRARNPTQEQEERRQWARDVSGLGDRYNPLEEPNIIQMNYEGRWENHLEGFMMDSGEIPPRQPDREEDSDESDF